MRRLLALSAVFVVLAALAAPWLVGVRAQTLFRHNVANLAEHLQMSIDITRYDRGWFSADAVTELRWGDRRAPVIVQHHITHGPFVAPGWADIESTIVRAHDPLLDYFFDGRSPLAVDTRIQYNGDATIHVSSPTFDKTSPKAPDLSIAWGGFDSKFRISGERHVDYSLQAPKLSIAAADGAIHLQGLALSGFSNMPAGTWQAGSPMDWDSEMLLRLEQARIRSAQENISVQAGLRWHMSTELDTADDLLFDNRLQFRDVDIHPLQGTMPAPFRLDDTALHIRLSGIATAPLADFITRLQALVRYMEVQYGSEGRYGNGRLQAFMERRLPQLLPELLSDRTRLLIEIPSFDSNQGALEFRLAAAINEQVTNNSSLPQWLQLLQQLEVTLDAAIDQSLVAYLPGHNMPLLRQLANERWLEHKEQRFCTSAELQNMQLHINGRSASGLLLQLLTRN